MGRGRVDVVVGVTPFLGHRIETYRRRLERLRGQPVSRTDALRVLLQIALDIRAPLMSASDYDNPGFLGVSAPGEPGGFIPATELRARGDIGKLERGEV
jgi:hypothetical protein